MSFDHSSMSVSQRPHASQWAHEILEQLFGDYGHGMAIEMWDGDHLHFGQGGTRFTLHLRRPAPLYRAILGNRALALAQAYFQGDLDISGDLYALLDLKNHFAQASTDGKTRAKLLWSAVRGLARSTLASKTATDTGSSSRALTMQRVHTHSRGENRRSIAFHYDVSNDFYRLWLDRNMVYSCAYFTTPDQSLEQAQVDKLDHICRKLRLRPGERLLDIGCGWGALILHAARHYGVQAHGITLSQKQLELARQRIDEAGLAQRVRVDLMDYRELKGSECYDKISSVGMFEHVGLRNLPEYFAIAHRLLHREGLFLNHGITHAEDGWTEDTSTRFINRYVFPDAQLDRISNVLCRMEDQSFEIWDVEGLRPHYALTLRHWVHRLEQSHDAAVAHSSEQVYRVWRMYMAACALQFENGHTGVYQVLASKRPQASSSSRLPLPLTRTDVYVRAS